MRTVVTQHKEKNTRATTCLFVFEKVFLPLQTPWFRRPVSFEASMRRSVPVSVIARACSMSWVENGNLLSTPLRICKHPQQKPLTSRSLA